MLYNHESRAQENQNSSFSKPIDLLGLMKSIRDWILRLAPDRAGGLAQQGIQTIFGCSLPLLAYLGWGCA